MQNALWKVAKKMHYASVPATSGEVMEIPKAVCLHEEDAGVLWKHMDYRTGHAEVRRSRRLALSFISTVVNYEYAFYWYFYQVRLCPLYCFGNLPGAFEYGCP